MLSKRKVVEAVANWVRDRLNESKDHSLRDDSDGISIRVESARTSGGLIFLDLSVVRDDRIEDMQLLLQVGRQVDPPAVPIGVPSADDLAELDNTA